MYVHIFICLDFYWMKKFWLKISFSATHKDVRVIVVGNGVENLSSDPGKVVSISLFTNALWKGMNPSVLYLLSIGILLDRLSSLTLLWKSVLEKQNSEFKLTLLHLKN